MNDYKYFLHVELFRPRNTIHYLYFYTMEEVEQFLATEYRDKTKYITRDFVNVMYRTDNGLAVQTIAID